MRQWWWMNEWFCGEAFLLTQPPLVSFFLSLLFCFKLMSEWGFDWWMNWFLSHSQWSIIPTTSLSLSLSTPTNNNKSTHTSSLSFTATSTTLSSNSIRTFLFSLFFFFWYIIRQWWSMFQIRHCEWRRKQPRHGAATPSCSRSHAPDLPLLWQTIHLSIWASHSIIIVSFPNNVVSDLRVMR